jgi:hypothetical protein
MQYLHDNLNMPIICGGKLQYWHYVKSTLSMGGQNTKSIYQTWNILSGI